LKRPKARAYFGFNDLDTKDDQLKLDNL
jgi:hypothetical protein